MRNELIHRYFLTSILLLTGCAQNNVNHATQTPPQPAPPKQKDSITKDSAVKTPAPVARAIQDTPHDTIQKIQLRRADAAELAEIIQKIFNITATYESRSNTLILSGDSVKVGNALQLAADCDRDTDGETFSIFFIYPLKNAHAVEITAIFQSLIDKGLFATDDLHPRASLIVVPDPRTNSLLIAASSRYEDQLRDILKTLDKELPK